MKLIQLMHTVILSDLPLLRLPLLHKVGRPEHVDEGIDEDEDVVEASQGAGPVWKDLLLLNPEEDLNDHGEEKEREGFDCQEFHELKVKGYLFTAVVSDTLWWEILELSTFELKLILDTHLCEVSLGKLALVLRVHLIDDWSIRSIIFLPVLLL